MTLKEKVTQVVYEALSRDVYKADVSLRSTKDRNITEILDEIRALCGVTIVNSKQSKKLGDGSEKSLISIKFFLTSTSLNDNLAKLAMSARKIDGVLSFKTLRVDKISHKEA